MNPAARAAPGRRRGGLRLFDLLLAVALLALVAVIAAKVGDMASVTLDGQATINDGDTLTVGKERMRLRGIDAPEFGQLCTDGGGSEFDCGRRARQALVEAVGGRAVACTGQERDKYGRLLVTCRAGTTDLNATMVRDGWAVSFGGYGAEEDVARERSAGLWAGKFERPRDWRVRRGDMLEAEHLAPSALRAMLRNVAAWLGLETEQDGGNRE